MQAPCGHIADTRKAICCGSVFSCTQPPITAAKGTMSLSSVGGTSPSS
nr:MAG TPA: hypothetical protein [Caudoviricetes sp.]